LKEKRTISVNINVYYMKQYEVRMIMINKNNRNTLYIYNRVSGDIYSGIDM